MVVWRNFVVRSTHNVIFIRLSSMGKKPVVIASNRGHYSSKNRRVVEWCLYYTRLEPSFKDKAVFLRLEVTGIELFLGIPTPVPTAGIPAR